MCAGTTMAIGDAKPLINRDERHLLYLEPKSGRG
jgi:hypothetical protein